MDPSSPLASPPPGVIPNFVSPENRSVETIIIVAICISLTAFFFLMRLYARIFITHSLGWDDYTCGAGVAGAVAFAGVFMNMLNYGFQTHSWDVTLGQLDGGLKYLLVYTLLYGPTIFFIKISILILYLRIFSPDRRVRYLIYAGIGYTLITNAVATILSGALCAPRNGQDYIVQYNAPECVDNIDNLALANAVVNVIEDIYLLLLPLPMVMKLQLSRKRRVRLIAVFMTGILACPASLASIVVRVKWAHNSDYMWWSPRIVFTILFEMNVGIICACLPSCAAIFRQPFPFSASVRSLFSRSAASKTGARSSSEQSLRIKETVSPTIFERERYYPYQGSYVELQAVTNSDDIRRTRRDFTASR